MTKIVLSKAVLGSTRPHKYIRRVRVHTAGKGLTWKYYYADDKQRQRGRARAKGKHKLMQSFDHDQGLLKGRKRLKLLNPEYITKKLGWEKPFKIAGDISRFHNPIAEIHERTDLHGQPMSPLRALDMVVDRLPPKLKGRLDGKLKAIKFVDAMDMPKSLRDRPDQVAMSTATQITLAVDRLEAWNSERNMNGGMPLVEAIMREYGQHMWARGITKEEKQKFVEFMAVKGNQEHGVTALAEESIEDRFAESFAAALLYPQQLAETSPDNYEWFRNWMGDNFLPPLETDAERRRVIVKEIKAVGLKGDKQRVRELRLEHDRLIGALDRPKDDPALQWWKPPETQLQTMLRQYPGDNWNGADYVQKQSPDDTFYELSHGGRTVYMRLKKGAKPGVRAGLTAGDFLGLWDENGNSLAERSAWWHLFQDEWGDKHAEMDGFFGFDVGKKAGDKHRKAFNRNSFFAKLWNAKGTLKPVEITEDEYRERSGALVLDSWVEPGKDLLDKMRAARPGTAAHVRLIDEYRRHQPNIEYSQVHVDQRLINQGLYPHTDLGRFVNLPTVNPDGTPRLTKKVYVQAMPDGSTVNVELLPGDETDPTAAGSWFIASPVWRALLTPNGEAIDSAETLRRLSAQATEAAQGRPPRPRRAWVTVQADTRGGDVPHYFHLNVEWDGRGLPKILGAEWKRRLGKDEPRISDLVVGEGTRARVKGEKIRLEKRRTRVRGPAALPKVGERVILTIHPGEKGMRFHTEQNAPFVLDRILPAKRPGDVPSEPGWDRMPEGVDEKLLTPNVFPEDHETYEGALAREVAAVERGEGAHELNTDERRFRDQGLLPEWYVGDPAQKSWYKRVFRPAYSEWQRTRRERLAQAEAERYVFIGEVGHERVGGKKVIRRGSRAVLDDINPPETVRRPRPLKGSSLVYLHEKVDDVTGEVQDQKLRLLLPSDGSVTGAMLENIPGLNVVRHAASAAELAGAVDYVELDMAGFAQVREQLGGVSMTGAAIAAINTRIGWLQDIANAQADQAHKIALNDIDPAVMVERGVELNAELFPGVPFVLAEHQKLGFQKVIDNDGRALIAHMMGTGKTVLAIALIKFMQSLKDPDDPSKPHALAPKKVLVTAPKSVVEQWRQEFALFDGNALVVGRGKSDIPYDEFIRGSQPGGPYENAPVVIMGSQYFTRHQKELAKAGFDGIVPDEMHKGTKGDKTKFIQALEAWNPNMKMFVGLTGTPITTSPADMLPFIKLLSKGTVWGDTTRADFIDEFLEASDVVATAGVTDRAAPKTQIKASKREELAAILAKWAHVVLSKDIRGKILPALRVGENNFAEMTGVQAQMYALAMAALGPHERAQLTANSALAADEMRGLSVDARRRVANAKLAMDAPAVKPASGEALVSVTVVKPTKSGRDVTARVAFRVFPGTSGGASAMDWLKKTSKGRWPKADELSEEERAIYSAHFRSILGAQKGGVIADVAYEEIAGTTINPWQWRAMKAAGWDKEGGQKVVNPDYGPIGVKFRGISVPKQLTDAEQVTLDNAMAFQNAFAAKLEDDSKLNHVAGLKQTADDFGVNLDTAQEYMRAHPIPTVWQDSYTRGGVTVTTSDEWVSDKTNSAHVIYRKQDWDLKRNRPKMSGPFKLGKTMDMVSVGVSGKYWFLKAPKTAPAPPSDLDLDRAEVKAWKAQWLADWRAGPFRYEERWGVNDKGQIALRNTSNDAIRWVNPKDVTEQVKSIFDPGMRKERDKYDLAMIAGNAKAEQFMDLTGQFFQHTDGDNIGHGHERERNLLIFASSIIGGARVTEAAARVMGFKDANEAIVGSPHYDPEDAGPAPNGKYFVTYIGGNYIGDRDLNMEIVRKKKDKTGRDTNTSRFVDKTMNGSAWHPWPGQAVHPLVKMSKWTFETRDRIHQQFKSINAPEAFIKNPKPGGPPLYYYGDSDKKHTFDDIQVPKTRMVREDGKSVRDPVTGLIMREPVLDAKGNPVTASLVTKGTADILRQMTLVGDPNTMKGAAAKEAERHLKLLQDEYVKQANKAAIATPPLNSEQINVFNNTVLTPMSDAGKEGINRGETAENIQWNALASPMDEQQRYARSARVLPQPVPPSLMNKYITAVRGHQGRKIAFRQLSSAPDHPSFVQGAALVRFHNGAWQPVKAAAAGVNDLLAWRKGGKIAIEYGTKEGDTVHAWVVPKDLSLADGPFKRIKDQMEVDAFKPGRTTGPQGKVTGLRVGASSAETTTYREALERVVLYAEEQADAAAEVKGKAAISAQWESIAARARVGVTVGTLEAKTVLESLKTTRAPGQKRTVLGYTALTNTDPLKGTYALHTAAERARNVRAELKEQGASPTDYHTQIQDAIEEPVGAINRILDGLSQQERDLISKAGFVKMGDKHGSLDAYEIFLALRTDEIFKHIEERRAVVAGEMRRSAAGKIVTDQDVMNRIIDGLSPMDRGVLKARKALVNVTRLGVSAWVPRTTTTPDPDDPSKKVTVFTGYDREHPVSIERNLRVVGKARTRPVENLYHDMQRDVQIRTPVDHNIVDHKAIINMKRAQVAEKAVRFVLNLRK